MTVLRRPRGRRKPGLTGEPAAEPARAGDEPAGSAARSVSVAGRNAARNPPGPVSDEALVRALYSEHAGPLLRYALQLTGGDRQRAEDIVQETLLRAWLHPEAIADRPARPWLFAVARNLAVDAHRARKARPM